MERKAIVFILVILIFLFTSLCAYPDQEEEGVLKPETANEARLNRLQPPDKVMDAIGIEPGMIVAEIGTGG
ncbi:MAG: hypothetical protein JXB23_16220 [Candidatus Aminicenantes bacterium]|nr:hypothetical protein [Candidatus Aminicenantes bacterium]